MNKGFYLFFLSLLGILFLIWVYEPNVFSWVFWASSEIEVDSQIYAIDKSAIVRNVGLLAFALIGICIAFWRGRAADRQNLIANQQADLAAEQHRLLLKQRNSDDKTRKAALLESGVRLINDPDGSVRIAGIAILVGLAEEAPLDFGRIVYNIFPAALCKIALPQKKRNARSKTKPSDLFNRPPRDILMLLNAIHEMKRLVGQSNPHLEKIDLSYYTLLELNLSTARLAHSAFRRAVMPDAVLSKADLAFSDLSGANLNFSNLSDVNFTCANLSDTSLLGANISGACFGGAKGLSIGRISGAWAWADNLPSELNSASSPSLSESILIADPSGRAEYEDSNKIGPPPNSTKMELD